MKDNHNRLVTVVRLKILVVTIFGVLSCSDSNSKDGCDRTNWYGTYDLVSSNCNNGDTAPFEDTYTLQEGTCPNCVSDPSTTQYEINDE